MSSKPETNRLPPAEQREHLMVRAAKLHYDLQYSRIEVAKELGLTRWQVSKLLEEARAEGIVQIKIEPRSKRLVHLEAELQRRYGLQDALVVQVPPNLDASLDFVAAAAGSYLASISSRVPLLGVSWGRTLAAVARWLPVGWHSGGRGGVGQRRHYYQGNQRAQQHGRRGICRARQRPRYFAASASDSWQHRHAYCPGTGSGYIYSAAARACGHGGNLRAGEFGG